MKNGKKIRGLFGLSHGHGHDVFELLPLVSPALILVGGDEEYQSGDHL